MIGSEALEKKLLGFAIGWTILSGYDSSRPRVSKTEYIGHSHPL
jgi:hypothetical protein